MVNIQAGDGGDGGAGQGGSGGDITGVNVTSGDGSPKKTAGFWAGVVGAVTFIVTLVWYVYDAGMLDRFIHPDPMEVPQAPPVVVEPPIER